MSFRKILIVSFAVLPMITLATKSWAETPIHENVQEIVWGEKTAQDKIASPCPCPRAQNRPMISDEGRALMHETMKTRLDANKTTLQALFRAENEARDLLISEKFNQKAYLKKANEVASLKAKIMKTRISTMATIASKLSLQDRKALGDHHFMHKGPMMMQGMGASGQEMECLKKAPHQDMQRQDQPAPSMGQDMEKMKTSPHHHGKSMRHQ